MEDVIEELFEEVEDLRDRELGLSELLRRLRRPDLLVFTLLVWIAIL